MTIKFGLPGPIITVALSLFVSPHALCADAKGKIKTVAAEENMFVLTDDTGRSWTIVLAKDAKIQLDGKDSKLLDLQTDDEVVITYEKDGERLVATSLKANRKLGKGSGDTSPLPERYIPVPLALSEDYLQATKITFATMASTPDIKEFDRAMGSFVRLTNTVLDRSYESKGSNPGKEKLIAYIEAWSPTRKYLESPTKATDAESRASRAAIAFGFKDSLVKATLPLRTCTVLVEKPEGVIVKYAKAPDADKAGSFREAGSTPPVLVMEIEKATYIFKCFRKGRETGRTGEVACTDAVKRVEIKED